MLYAANKRYGVKSMPARAYWYDEVVQNLIVLELSGDWTKEEYKALMDESLVMLKSVSHPAVIIQYYVSKKPQAFSSAVMKIWFATYKQWTETENYANFWISVSHGYWERLFVWA